MDQRIQAAGVTAGQVQVVWLKQAEIGPAQLGEFPAHAESLRDDVADDPAPAQDPFPEPAASRTCPAGSMRAMPRRTLNPEPYAYESAFSVRWLIESQVANDPNLNYDPARGRGQGAAALVGSVPVGRWDQAPAG